MGQEARNPLKLKIINPPDKMEYDLLNVPENIEQNVA